MKFNKSLIVLSSIILLASCGGNKKSNPTSTDSTSVKTSTPAETSATIVEVKKYPIKSAIVTFENDMMGIKQKAVLYIDDYGVKEAEETYDGDKVKEIDMCDGKTRYGIVIEKKTAYIKGNAIRGIAYKFDWNEISKADKEYKVKKLANVSVAGKDCESYSLNSGDFPTVFAGWNNVLLYQQTKTKYGTIIKKAIKIEENATIPAEKFTIPQGFAIVNNK